MIVHTMSETELKTEIVQDMQNVLKYSDFKDQKFRRLVLKSSKFPVYAHSFYKSPKKNNWIILFESRSKKEIGDLSRIIFITYYNTPHGLDAIFSTFTNGKLHLIVYPPHFFSRFAERMNINLTGIDLMIRYFKFNYDYAFNINEVKTEEGIMQEIFATSSEGVALGYISIEGNILLKTFVSTEMLKGEQIETYAQTEKIRREMHEA